MSDITPTPAAVEIQRGELARQALENPIVVEALNAWEQEITTTWQNSPLRDVDAREKLRLMLEAGRQFRQHLTRTLETGELRKAQTPKKPGVLQRLRGAA